MIQRSRHKAVSKLTPFEAFAAAQAEQLGPLPPGFEEPQDPLTELLAGLGASRMRGDVRSTPLYFSVWHKPNAKQSTWKGYLGAGRARARAKNGEPLHVELCKADGAQDLPGYRKVPQTCQAWYRDGYRPFHCVQAKKAWAGCETPLVLHLRTQLLVEVRGRAAPVFPELPFTEITGGLYAVRAAPRVRDCLDVTHRHDNGDDLHGLGEDLAGQLATARADAKRLQEDVKRLQQDLKAEQLVRKKLEGPASKALAAEDDLKRAYKHLQAEKKAKQTAERAAASAKAELAARTKAALAKTSKSAPERAEATLEAIRRFSCVPAGDEAKPCEFCSSRGGAPHAATCAGPVELRSYVAERCGQTEVKSRLRGRVDTLLETWGWPGRRKRQRPGGPPHVWTGVGPTGREDAMLCRRSDLVWAHCEEFRIAFPR